jgi:multiple sugar transport system permease protein
MTVAGNVTSLPGEKPRKIPNGTVAGAEPDGRTSGPGGTRGRWPARGGSAQGWLFCAPALAILIAMTVVAGIYVFYIGFFRVNVFGGGNRFAGLANYQYAFTTYNLHGNLIRTIAFVVVAVGIELVAGGFLAFQLAKRIRGTGVAGILLLIPFAMTPAVSAMIFRILLDPSSGWIDHYLQSAGLISQPIQWLSDSQTAWVALIGLDIWSWTPFVALVLLAGIQNMPREVLEAASLDGAHGWTRLRYIILPLISPFIAIAGVLRTIQAFQTVDSFLILTNGGPGDSTTVANLSIYRLIVQNFSIGLGAATAVVVLILLLALTPMLMRIVGKYAEHERGAA